MKLYHHPGREPIASYLTPSFFFSGVIISGCNASPAAVMVRSVLYDNKAAPEPYWPTMKVKVEGGGGGGGGRATRGRNAVFTVTFRPRLWRPTPH